MCECVRDPCRMMGSSHGTQVHIHEVVAVMMVVVEIHDPPKLYHVMMLGARKL